MIVLVNIHLVFDSLWHKCHSDGNWARSLNPAFLPPISPQRPCTTCGETAAATSAPSFVVGPNFLRAKERERAGGKGLRNSYAETTGSCQPLCDMV